MGIDNAGQLMHRALLKNASDFVVCLMERNQSLGRSTKPLVDIDASWLGHSSRGQSNAVVSYVMDFAVSLASMGIDVTLVLDGDQRHHSKAASTLRKSVREAARIKAIHLRSKLLQLPPTHPHDAADANSGATDASDERTKMEQDLRKAETKSISVVPSNFASALQLAVENLRSVDSSTGAVRLIQAVFQADSIIAHRLITQQSLCVIGNDADFAFLAGASSIQVTNFRFNARNKSIQDISLACLFQRPLKEFVSILRRPDIITLPKLDASNFPRFENPKIRSLIAVALGCDTLPKGIKGFGPAKIATVLEKTFATSRANSNAPNTTSDDYDLLLQLISSTTKVSIELLDTCSKAFLYEPVILKGYNETEPYTYVHSSPATLPEYLEEFACPVYGKKVDGPTTLRCVGPGDGAHKFLELDGFATCCDCNRFVCRFCQCCSNEGSETRCFECHAAITLVPLPTNIDGGVVADDLRLTEIREKLLEMNCNSLSDATPTELYELYDRLVVKKELSFFDSSKVKFPLQPSSALDFSNGLITSVSEFKIGDAGGKFIRDSRLDIKSVISVVDLLADYIDFSGNVETQRRYGVHSVLPDIIIQFAQESRLDNAYRLLHRCVRHAMDPKMASIREASFRIVKYDQQIGIMISAKVPPSFSTAAAAYSVQLVVVKEAIVACRCSCKAGSENHNRHLDVHILPVLYQLSLVLADCLADSLLYELAHYVNHRMDEISNADANRLKVAVTKMVRMTRYGNRIGLEGENLYNLLEPFHAKTEQHKPAPPPPNRNMLCPIRTCRLINPVSKAKTILVKSGVSLAGVKVDDDNNNEKPKTAPAAPGVGDAQQSTSADKEEAVNYPRVLALITAWTNVLKGNFVDKEYVGYQLLSHRANHQVCYGSGVDYSTMLVQARKDVKKLVASSSGRTTQSKQSAVANKSLSSLKRKLDFDDKGSNHNKKAKAETLTTLTRNQEKVNKQREVWKGYRKGKTKYCAFSGCNNHNGEKGGFPMIRVPYCESIMVPPKPDAQKKTWESYATKLLTRNEWLDRIGHKRNAPPKDLRICNQHPTETNVKWTTYERQRRGVQVTERLKVEINNIPKALGVKSLENSSLIPSKGLGVDRLLVRHGEAAKQRESLGGPEADVACLQRELQQLSENKENEVEALRQVIRQLTQNKEVKTTQFTETAMINGKVAQVFGLDATNSNSFVSPLNNIVTINNETSKQATKTAKKQDTTISIGLQDSEVERRTGFRSLLHMMAFVAVVSNGNMAELEQKVSTMTWLEEWFFYFEKIWGRTNIRDRDASQAYAIAASTLRNVHNSKMEKVLKAKDMWPRYASLNEDMAFRHSKWSSRYGDERIVFWDNTDIRLPKPGDPELQRLTYSAYYAGNVAKGGVFLQLCGWLGTEELWTGAISDSDYLVRSGILQKQKEFVQNSGEGKPFTNILDKGFRNAVDAIREGNQMTLQPFFAESAKKFESNEVHHSAAIAADRSANERAVRCCKLSNLLDRGLANHGNTIYLADTWLAWAFQVNFMFKKVI